MKMTLSVLAALFPILMYACVSVPQKPAAVQPAAVETGRQAPAAVKELVRERITFLESVLESKPISSKNRKTAQSLLASYRDIQSYSNNIISGESSKIVAILIESLELLEHQLLLAPSTKTSELTSSLQMLEKEERRILELFESKYFDAVIAQCLELRSLFGRQALTPRIGLVFALSLAEKGRLREAVQVGGSIAGYLAKNPGLTDLQLAMTRWNLQLGREGAARETYEELNTRLKQQNSQADVLSAQIETSPEAPLYKEIDRSLERVKRLIREKSFVRARDILEAVSSKAKEKSSIRAIEAVYRVLEKAESEYLENKIAVIARKKEGLQSARKLLEQEKFQQAIDEIEFLEAAEAANPELMQLKRLAIERLINRERNRAAKLFLMAKKTSDHKKKTRHLRSSLKILKSIYNKYPASALNYKVKSHIEQVSEELAGIE